MSAGTSIRQVFQKVPELARYLLLVGTIVLISFLFPNNARFQYEFHKDQSWSYDDLYAPFDFPIQKTAAELAGEREQVVQEFSPVYQKDTAVKNTQLEKFRAAFKTQVMVAHSDTLLDHFKNNQSVYESLGERLLGSAYQYGIIRLDSLHTEKGGRFVIQVRAGGSLTPYTLQSLKTSEQALQSIRQELIASQLPDAGVLLLLIEPLVKPDITYDADFSNQLLDQEISKITPSKGVVRKAELIVNRDGIVTDEIYQKLLSFKAAYETEITKDKSYWGVFLGYLFLSAIILGAYFIFLRYNAQRIYGSTVNFFFMMLWIIAFSYLVYVIDPVDVLSTYIIPFCIVPIVLKNFFNERVALFTHLVIVLIASFLTSLGYEFTFLTLLAGIIATLTITETREWSKFFTSILLIFLTYTIGFIGLSLIQDGSFANIHYQTIYWMLLNSVLIMLAYPLIPLLGRIFGYTSSISLTELADLNRPLLKELSIKAPGTMQHSLQVANLAEAAAVRIGARSLLVKVGALYHDIGKIKQPRFYVENQQNGVNPHDEIGEKESAKIIIEHVTEGVKMAEKARLPKAIVDFIRTHHGTTMTAFFYKNYKAKHPNEEVKEADFTYPGPKPSTKEQAILMIADSLEAASKAMQKPTPESLHQLVENLTQQKINEGQFSDCDITFADLEACKTVFENMLVSIYQPRIEYPE